MTIYSIIMFAAAVLFFAFGVAIYRGNTKLIQEFHQTNVKESERQEYGRAFAKGIFAICITLLISGIAALLTKAASFAAAVCVAIPAVGLIVSFIILLKVQKKYNGGLF